MAERNKPVKIYLAYSEKDKISKTARENIRSITAFLEQPDNNGESYAEILNPLPDPKVKSKENEDSNSTRERVPPDNLQKDSNLLCCQKIYRFLCAIISYVSGFRMENVWQKAVEKFYNYWYRFGREKRKVKKRQNIRSANIILLLYSDNIKEKDDTIFWVIRTAQKANRSVVICSLDNTKELEVPDWLKKTDDRAKTYTWDSLREKIELYVEKKYKVFLDIKGNPSAEPCIDNIGPRIIEQYQTYMQSIEHQENARQAANNAYITVNSAFLALLGVIMDKDNFFTIQNAVFMLIVSVVGLRFHGAWMRTLDYYAQINTAKQRIVNHLERYLPLQLNSTEYYEAMQSPFEKQYKRLNFPIRKAWRKSTPPRC